MTPPVKPIPTDRPQLVPYITVNDGAAAVDFYVRAFGATEVIRLAEPGGRIGHAELSIGNAGIMLSDRVSGDGRAESAQHRRLARRHAHLRG